MKIVNWPNDVDGDVFRRLEQNGFDFEKVAKIDFDIDFDHWPLTNSEKKLVINLYPNSEIYEPDEEDLQDGNTIGYIQCSFETKLTYKYVMETQEKLSKEFKSIGGWCNSWGVWS